MEKRKHDVPHAVMLLKYSRGLAENYSLWVNKDKGYADIFHVVGDIDEDYRFYSFLNIKDCLYTSKEFIGFISHKNLRRFRSVVERVEPPKKQTYEDSFVLKNPKEPIKTDKDWVLEVIQALKDKGILYELDNEILSSQEMLDMGEEFAAEKLLYRQFSNWKPKSQQVGGEDFGEAVE